MGLFIDVRLDAAAAKDSNTAQKLAEVCPVGIFAVDAQGQGTVVEENVDECTLCELCLAVCDDSALKVVKLYDNDTPLKRTGS